MTEPTAPLTGPRLLAARSTWLLLVVFAVSTYLAGLAVRARDLQVICRDAEVVCHQNPPRPTADDAAALQTGGLSLSAYSTLETVKLLVFSSVWFAVGGLIFARKSDDRAALIFSFFLVIFITGVDGIQDALSHSVPALWLPLHSLHYLASACFALFIAMFPNGRFVPRWTAWIFLASAIVSLPSDFVPGWDSRPSTFTGLVSWAGNFATVGLLLAGQVLRYRLHASPAERGQMRWVLLGVTACLIIIAVLVVAVGGVPRLSPLYFVSELIYQIAVALVPISIGASILRYRLWDIDVLIRRTLVYSLLTALLALVYFGSILLLQSAFTALTGQGSPIALVVSTLAIAALFLPLRARIQTAIDKRFYRRKYDAARALAAFSAAAPNETDLESLMGRLRDMLDETMEPESMIVWLKPE